MNTQRKAQYESALLISFMSFPLMQSPLPEHGIIEAKILHYCGMYCPFKSCPTLLPCCDVLNKVFWVVARVLPCSCYGLSAF